MQTLSIILPAKNEEQALTSLLPELRAQFPAAEVIVVDDGSTDGTAAMCRRLGIHCIVHPYSMGNGAAIKSGARAANGQTLVFMDADGQHRASDIPRLLEMLEHGYDMVVGARNQSSQANLGRLTANAIYNAIASWMVNHTISDLTSGMRAVNATKFREFLHLLPNGFSYPTTITMAFFRAGYPVGYLPITAARRIGKSHIRPLRDGARFFLIIFRIGTLYSPLKLFVPMSLAFFLLGLAYYLYTYLTIGRLTNMSALLLSTSVLVFLIGLVSEQITNLLYLYGNTDKKS
jgi:glycosyltransferase involved in cell wall biosynthesis